MSLKSFDKFCEDLILKKPGSEKVIFDERQKLVQMQLGIETLTIFGAVAFVNCLIMDMAYQYAETYSAPILLLMILCAFYYSIRCAAKGCLVGIGGERALKWSAGYSVFMGVMMMIKFLFGNDGERVLLVNGRLGDDFCFMIVWILAILYGITTLILINIYTKKKEQEEREEKHDEP